MTNELVRRFYVTTCIIPSPTRHVGGYYCLAIFLSSLPLYLCQCRKLMTKVYYLQGRVKAH